MSEFPAMPLWIDAFMVDCGHLDDAETGRYMLILFKLWLAPKQRLPNNDTWLARQFRRTEDAVRLQLRPLIREFCQCSGNWITQERLTREYAYVSSRSKKQSVRAKLRWDKEKRLCRGNAPTPTPTRARTRDAVQPLKLIEGSEF